MAFVLSLTACSDRPESAAPGVATIKSAAASAPPRERPILRPNAALGERDRLLHAYGMGRHDQGIPTSSTATVIVKLTLPEYADKEPQYWMDVERQTNPEFLDKLRAEAAGLTDPTTIQFGSCEREAFVTEFKKYRASPT